MVNMVNEVDIRLSKESRKAFNVIWKNKFGNVLGVPYYVPVAYKKCLPPTFRVLQWHIPRDGSRRLGVFEFFGDTYEILSKKVFLWTEGSSTMMCVPRPSCLPPPPPPSKKRLRKDLKKGSTQDWWKAGTKINHRGPDVNNSRCNRGERLNDHKRHSGYVFVDVKVHQVPKYSIYTYDYTKEWKPVALKVPAELPKGTPTIPGSQEYGAKHIDDVPDPVSSMSPEIRPGYTDTPSPLTHLPDQVPQIDNKYLFEDAEHSGVIGKGAYGCVTRAVYQTSSFTKSVAVKAFTKGQTSPGEVLYEARILTLLNTTGCIPLFYGITPTPIAPRLALVQEYFAQGKTLLAILNSQTEIQNDTWLDISLQLAVGLREIHSRGVLINDIKEDNLLVDSNFIVKYIDFGFATYRKGKQITIPEDAFHKYPHIAPEVRRGGLTTHSSDIYSLGVTLETIMADGMIDEMWEVVSSCIDNDAASRPGTYELVCQLGHIREGLKDEDIDV